MRSMVGGLRDGKGVRGGQCDGVKKEGVVGAGGCRGGGRDGGRRGFGKVRAEKAASTSLPQN